MLAGLKDGADDDSDSAPFDPRGTGISAKLYALVELEGRRDRLELGHAGSGRALIAVHALGGYCAI